LTGSVTLTDLTSGTLTATIAANSVALGTDTTGNYVGSIADGSPGAQTGTSGLTISAVAGENTSATIAHADTSSVSNLSSDNSNGIVLQDISFTFDGFGHVTAASVITTDLDSRYVNTSGDTMTGFLTLHADPSSSLHAATKQYVDNVAQGLHTHAPCAAATTATLTSITGGTITYSNGTAGVGATLTVSGGTFGTIDGVNIATVGTRILVKNEAAAANNGIYTYTNSTTLTRATDFDTPTEMAGGDFTFVQQGTLYNDTGWVMSDPVTTVGTTAVNFVQFSGAGTYTAGSGLTLNGTEFSHTDTSSVASLTASSRTYVSGLTFDTFGHVTGITTNTETVTDTNTTYTLDGSGTTNSVNIELVAGGSGSGTDTINVIGSGATTVSWDEGNQRITISSTDTNTTYSAATSTTLGLIELFSDTQQSVAANAVSATASRTYGLQINASGQGVINVPWTDTTYSAATSTTLGLIELFSDTQQSVAANSVTSTASRTYGLQVNAAGQGVINVPWTDTTYSLATSTVPGLVELGSDTVQTVAANAVTSTASRSYAVQLNAFGQMLVNIPWTDTDTNTTYSISAETVAGGANLRLTGSDASTDNVTLAAGSNITITRTDANTITIASTGGGGGSWSVKTSNYTAASGDQLLANTSGGSFTITLPATPSAGNSVVIADGNNWQTNNLTVARNGSTIKGLSEDLILNIAGVKVDFVYSGSTWCVFAFASGGEDPLAAALAIGDEL